MGKSTHFFGQPVYGQLIKSLDHDKIVEISRKHGGVWGIERSVFFNGREKWAKGFENQRV